MASLVLRTRIGIGLAAAWVLAGWLGACSVSPLGPSAPPAAPVDQITVRWTGRVIGEAAGRALEPTWSPVPARYRLELRGPGGLEDTWAQTGAEWQSPVLEPGAYALRVEGERDDGLVLYQGLAEWEIPRADPALQLRLDPRPGPGQTLWLVSLNRPLRTAESLRLVFSRPDRDPVVATWQGAGAAWQAQAELEAGLWWTSLDWLDPDGAVLTGLEDAAVLWAGGLTEAELSLEAPEDGQAQQGAWTLRPWLAQSAVFDQALPTRAVPGRSVYAALDPGALGVLNEDPPEAWSVRWTLDGQEAARGWSVTWPAGLPPGARRWAVQWLAPDGRLGGAASGPLTWIDPPRWAGLAWAGRREESPTERGLAGVRSLALSPDGAYLAALAYDTKGLGLWRRRAEDGALKPAGSLTDTPAGGTALAFSPGGTRLAALGRSGPELALWNRSPGRADLSAAFRSTDPRLSGAAALVFRADDELWTLSSAGPLRWRPQPPEPETAGEAGTSGSAGTPTVWVPTAWTWAPGHFSEPSALADLGNGEWAWLDFAQDRLEIWRLDAEELWQPLQSFTDGQGGCSTLNGPSALALSKDRLSLWVAAYYDHAVTRFERASLEAPWTLAGHFVQGQNGAEGLRYPRNLALDEGAGAEPPGLRRLWVAGTGSDALGVLTAEAGGPWTWAGALKDGEAGLSGLDGPRGLAAARDELFVGSGVSRTLQWFRP